MSAWSRVYISSYVLPSLVNYYTILYYIILYYTILYYTILYYTLHFITQSVDIQTKQFAYDCWT